VFIIFLKVFLGQLDEQLLTQLSFFDFILLVLFSFEHEKPKQHRQPSCLNECLSIFATVELVLGESEVEYLDNVSPEFTLLLGQADQQLKSLDVSEVIRYLLLK